MKGVTLLSLCMALVLLGASGCAGYRRGTTVPEELRTVHVPAFENQTIYPMSGAIAVQQFLDALIEDGTFRPERYEVARLRTQVVLESLNTRAVRYDRNHAIVPEEYRLTLVARLYVFDRKSGKTLVNGKLVRASDSALTRGDMQTGVMDALPRVSRALAERLLEALVVAAEADVD